MATEIKQKFEKFEGTWKKDKDDNFEAFLDANGVGYLKKKAATSVTPTMTISVEGETININISMGSIKTIKSSFKLGEAYKAEGPGGGSGTAISTYDDGKIITEITPDDDKKPKQSVVRDIIDGVLVQTMTVKKVTCKRFFKKQLVN